MEPLYQGAKDVFLVKVRADFDALQNQALVGLNAIKNYKLVDTDPLADSIFTRISDTTAEGSRAVWRHVGTTGVEQLSTRIAGGVYPDVQFIRTYETSVVDPNNQIAGRFIVPEEREMKEARSYKEMLNRASKLMYEVDRYNILDPFEVFNLGFTAVADYPGGIAQGRFFARGNQGLNGTNTALGERLYSTSHALANGGTAISNVVTTSGLSQSLSYAAYWQAKELGASFNDDVGKPMPRFGGKTCIMVPPKNSLALTAQVIQTSQWKPGIADNDVNIVQGDFSRIISSPYLSDSFYVPGTVATTHLAGYQWHLVDESNRDPSVGTGLVAITFVPQESRVERDLPTDSIVYKIKQELVYGFVDWRNAIGSPGNNLAYAH